MPAMNYAIFSHQSKMILNYLTQYNHYVEIINLFYQAKHT